MLLLYWCGSHRSSSSPFPCGRSSIPGEFQEFQNSILHRAVCSSSPVTRWGLEDMGVATDISSHVSFMCLRPLQQGQDTPPTSDFTHHWAVFTHTNIHPHVYSRGYPHHLLRCHKSHHALWDMDCGKIRSYSVQSHQCAQELWDTNRSSSKCPHTSCHVHPHRVHSDDLFLLQTTT